MIFGHMRFVGVALFILFFSLLPSSFLLGSTPNILFVLVDDLAWTDLGSYGHPWHETPHIDSLASDGMRFTQAYSPAPICSSARASILTGKTPARLGLEFVVKAEAGEQVIQPPQALKAPPFTLALDLEETTIAEQLSKAGYDTAYFGKWHLNPHYQGRYLAWSPTHGPGRQGFQIAEEDFGSHPYRRIELPTLFLKDSYHSDGITDRAIRYLQQPREDPFFLMVSHFYVHTPVQSSYDWLLKKYDSKIPPNILNRNKRIEYAAFVETLDFHVGQLLAGLDETGLKASTLVVFSSDNGGHPEYVSHAPLRGSKWNLYEGGIRVPLLVRWPEVVEPGSECGAPIIGYDLFATLCEVAGIKDHRSGGNRDGTSFLPFLKNPDEHWERSLYWHFPYYHPEGDKFANAIPDIGVDDFIVSRTRPHSAIRKGRFKLIYFDEDERVELYDLSEDVSESRDLTNLFSDKVTELKQELSTYLQAVKARKAAPNL